MAICHWCSAADHFLSLHDSSITILFNSRPVLSLFPVPGVLRVMWAESLARGGCEQLWAERRPTRQVGMDSLCRGSIHIKKFGLYLADRGLVIKDFKHWRSMEIRLLVRSAAYSMKKGQEGADKRQETRQEAWQSAA